MKMRANWSFRIAALAAVLIMGVGFPQAQSDMGKQNQFQLAGINGSVKGNGTVNHVSKWVGDGQIGDSAIVETGGKVALIEGGTLSFKLTSSDRARLITFTGHCKAMI